MSSASWPRPSGPLVRRALVALLALGVLAWILLLSPLSQVRQVSVLGVQGDTQAKITALADPAVGQPLLKVDTDALADRVLSLGTIARVEVQRRWPATVVIRAQVRVPVYAVENSAGQIEISDAAGIPYWTTTRAPSEVPVITFDSPPTDATRSAAATILSALSAAQRARVRDVRVISADLVELVIGDVFVEWGSAERSDAKAKIVEVLVQRKGVVRVNVTVPETPVTSTRPKSINVP